MFVVLFYSIVSLSFDVLSQLIIHLMESLIRLGKKAPVNYMASRDRTEFILDQTLAWIISQVRFGAAHTYMYSTAYLFDSSY